MTKLADILDDVSTMLVRIAGSTVLTGEHRIAQHDAPPRVIWVVTGANPEGAAHNKTISARPTRTLQVDAWNAECHCWGIDFRHAEGLRAATVTAVRRRMGGRNYQVRDTHAGDQAWVHRGFALTVNFEFWVPLEETALPSLEPSTYPEVPIHSVAVKVP